jgi:hypothetical protein
MAGVRHFFVNQGDVDATQNRRLSTVHLVLFQEGSCARSTGAARRPKVREQATRLLTQTLSD